MTKIERLEIYKKMLKDYRICNIPLIGGFFKQYLNTFAGFCSYLYQNRFNFILNDLIELNKLRPISRKNNNSLWFEEGLLKPRIELLKKAISDTKMHIEIERLMLEK